MLDDAEEVLSKVAESLDSMQQRVLPEGRDWHERK